MGTKRRSLLLSVAMLVVLGRSVVGPAAALEPAKPTTVSPLELADPITKYKLFVIGEGGELVKRTRAFTEAVTAGNLAKARALYAPARAPYERVEPIAELFDDLDKAIDSRVKDHADNPTDPEFTGFHRLEYGLWVKNSTAGLAPVANRLLADVTELQKRIRGLTFPPEKVVGGAAALIEEVAATKISGEEDAYSHTDLSDFDANLVGAKKIVDLFRPLLQRADGTRLARVDTDFGKIDTILGRYRHPDGTFEGYEKLTGPDRNGLQGPITTLAEDLSTLRGTLGLN